MKPTELLLHRLFRHYYRAYLVTYLAYALVRVINIDIDLIYITHFETLQVSLPPLPLTT